MIRPSAGTVRALLALALLALVVNLSGLDAAIWRFGASLLFGLLLLDVLLLERTPAVRVARSVRTNLPVNRWSSVQLTLTHAGSGGRPLRLRVHDALPAAMDSQGLPADLVLAPGEAVRVEYGIRPFERGNLELGRTTLVVNSALGCWQLRRTLGVPSAVRVYPDFSIIARYLEMVPDHRSAQMGIRKGPRRGEGLEFHQLREYRVGDTLRQIDWKATSRRRTLISREYQEERDQQILFLIDSGRRMRSREGELSHFDHALNAMLLLAYVALRQGDVVSALSFGASTQWVPGLRGVNAINRLLNAVYDMDSGAAASDYIVASEQVMLRLRKRALVVLMTNLREEDEDLAPALKLLRRRHVVLLANLREHALEETRAEPVHTLDDALRLAGAEHYLAQRARVQRALHPSVDLLIDSTPAELPIRVVNGYWQIKNSGLL